MADSDERFGRPRTAVQSAGRVFGSEGSFSERSGLKEFLGEFVRALPPALAAFVHAYVGGQLTAFPRNSIGHVASVLGVSIGYVRTLLRDPRWDEGMLRGQLYSHVQRIHRKRLRGVLFEQFLKQPAGARPPEHSPSSGEKGRSLRSISLTNLVLADRDFCCCLESSPCLPPGWREDDPPKGARELPLKDRHPSKWKGALDLVNRAKQEGMIFEWLLLGRSYGAELAFLQFLEESGQRFIAEVPASLRGWLYHPMIASANHEDARTFQSGFSPGRSSRPPHSIKDLTSGLTHWEKPARDGSGASDREEQWKARILFFYPEDQGLPTSPLGLLVLRDAFSGDLRHFVGNGFLGVSLRNLVDLALSKDKIEEMSRELSDRVGLADFRFREVDALRRHLVLSTLSMLFHAERKPSPSEASRASPRGST